jgi:hypothetical protein
MFDVIKAGLTPYEAEVFYPNDSIVLLFPTDGGDHTKGDVIFVGDVAVECVEMVHSS